MSTFKKGDLIIGSLRDRDKAYHPIVFIGGTDKDPLGVVITKSGEYSCNIKLSETYLPTGEPSYFVGHLIQKMREWGPYTATGEEVTKKDLDIIERSIHKCSSITWKEYEDITKKGKSCPDHTRN